MKLVLAILVAFLAGNVAMAGNTYVRPYVKKDGTYVQGHMRSTPNERRIDNYGAQNSIYGGNPYTGQRGSQRDAFSSPPAYNQPRRNCVPTHGVYGGSSC